MSSTHGQSWPRRLHDRHIKCTYSRRKGLCPVHMGSTGAGRLMYMAIAGHAGFIPGVLKGHDHNVSAYSRRSVNA